jgi:hypothetical protein
MHATVPTLLLCRQPILNLPPVAPSARGMGAGGAHLECLNEAHL